MEGLSFLSFFPPILPKIFFPNFFLALLGFGIMDRWKLGSWETPWAIEILDLISHLETGLSLFPRSGFTREYTEELILVFCISLMNIFDGLLAHADGPVRGKLSQSGWDIFITPA